MWNGLNPFEEMEDEKGFITVLLEVQDNLVNGG